MHKGQSSVDLILAILVALAFFAVMNIHNDNLGTQVSELSVKNGMKSILLDVYSATASAKAYGVSIEYISPKLKIGQSAVPLNCNINFRNIGSNDYISVTSGGVTETYSGISLDNITIDSSSIQNNTTVTRQCGQKFTIARSP